MTGSVVTAEAETACALLFRTLGAHRAAVARLPEPGTSRRLAGPAEDRAQIQCQATFVRLLSITEAFCAERLLGRVELMVDPSRGHTVARVWDEAALSATRGWEDQRRAYDKWLGVTADWAPIQELADVRNAVAHGLGTLTRRQRLNEAKTRAKIAAAGIALEQDRIILSDAVLATAASVCRRFIEQVDVAVQRQTA